MARQRKHGNGDGVHVDVRNIIIPLWLGISITLGFCGFIGTGVITYQSLNNKVDLLIVNQAEAFTKTDHRVWCLETQDANAKIGWRCTYSTSPPTVPTKQMVRPRVSEKSTVIQGFFK